MLPALSWWSAPETVRKAGLKSRALHSASIYPGATSSRRGCLPHSMFVCMRFRLSDDAQERLHVHWLREVAGKARSE